MCSLSYLLLNILAQVIHRKKSLHSPYHNKKRNYRVKRDSAHLDRYKNTIKKAVCPDEGLLTESVIFNKDFCIDPCVQNPSFPLEHLI